MELEFEAVVRPGIELRPFAEQDSLLTTEPTAYTREMLKIQNNESSSVYIC